MWKESQQAEEEGTSVYFSWNNWISQYYLAKFTVRPFQPYVKVPLFEKSLRKRKKRDRMTLKLTQVEPRRSTRPATVNQNYKLPRNFVLFAIIPLNSEKVNTAALQIENYP